MLAQISGYPGGKNGLWTSACDVCGKPMNGLYANEARAMDPLLAHLRDKHPELAGAGS